MPGSQGKAFCSRKTAPTLESSSKLGTTKQKNTPCGVFFCLAQRRGFEPPVSFRPTHDFQSCSLNHSDISASAFLKLPIYITVFFQKMQAFLRCFRKNLLIYSKSFHKKPPLGKGRLSLRFVTVAGNPAG